VTLAQWRQADEMISKRSKQLTRFTTSLLRRSPIGVASSLGLSLRDVQRVMGARYGTARKLSDLWLEFWFGWKPAVADIYAASEVFDNFIPWAHLRSAVSRTDKYYQAPSTFWSEGIDCDYRVACQIGVDVRLVNPNVRLMQQFGVLNPATVLWDAIPWSFVVGWFANVDSWLSSFTDFAGFEVSNGYISRKIVLKGKTFWPAYPGIAGGEGMGLAVSRSLFSSVPRPSLVLKDLTCSPLRALTSISLLTQQLAKIR